MDLNDLFKEKLFEAAPQVKSASRVLMDTMGHAAGTAGQDAGFLAGVFPKASFVPVNMRQYAYTLAGGQAPMKESDFSEDDLSTLKDAVKRKIEQTGQLSGLLSYGDYAKDGQISPVESSGPIDMIRQSFSNPVFRLESTLGTVRYGVNSKGEIEVHDSYDFGADRNIVDAKIKDNGRVGTLLGAARHSGLWGVLNAAGNMVRPNGTGTPFTLNLGGLK